MTRNQFAQELLLKEQRVERWEHYHDIPEENYLPEDLDC